MSPVVKVAIKDRNESAGAVLLAPVNGAPISWINDQRNSDGSGMYRMDQQRHSGLAYNNLSLYEHDEAEEDPNPTPSL